ncbi:YkvA family protein [Bradyrhizobium sp.]|uniref:YkvA family protein n=1 Tax=Bradyrhizobium sp. TaxID=376 RepID=UPI0025B9C6BD|nr:YkvA family protein [Bradyrhizobium sp.]
MLSRIKTWARGLNRDGHALYLASRDQRVPWYAKVFAMAIAAYALSPIDLIPDFIPIVGYLDELIILPLGIWLVVSLIPEEVMVECRAKVDAVGQSPVSRAGMIAIIVLWILSAMAVGWIGYISWTRLE